MLIQLRNLFLCVTLTLFSLNACNRSESPSPMAPEVGELPPGELPATDAIPNTPFASEANQIKTPMTLTPGS